MTDFTGGTWRSLVDGSEVVVIPDSEVWESESSSETFWEENTEWWSGDPDEVSTVDDDSDFGIGRGAASDWINGIDDWDKELDVSSIDDSETISIGSTDETYLYDFRSSGGRYWNHIDKTSGPGDTTVITSAILGPWDVSNANNVHVRLGYNNNGSGTAGIAAAILEEGTTNHEIIGSIEQESGEDDFSLDISDKEGSHKIVILSGDRTSDNTEGEFTDIFFD